MAYEESTIKLFNSIDSDKIVAIDSYGGLAHKFGLSKPDYGFDNSDTWRWQDYISGGESAPVETGGVLNCDIASGGSGTRIRGYVSSIEIPANMDFDIPVDFSGFVRNKNVLNTIAYLYMWFEISGYRLQASRLKNDASDLSRLTLNHPSKSNIVSDATTSTTSGKFRIKRMDGVAFVGFYDDLTAEWRWESMPDYSNAAGLLRIYARADDDCGVEGDFSNFLALEGGWFPTDTPSPTQIWTVYPVGTKIDMATLHIFESSTSALTYKLAVNGGAQGASQTQAQLQAEGIITVTDATQSISIQPQLPWSSGEIRPEMGESSFVDVEYPGGGGGARGLGRGLA